jgi:multiple antibiotic resistance protein
MMLIIYFFFVFSSKIVRVVGDKVMKALTRIFGLLVAGVAVQFFIIALESFSLIKIA